MARQINSPKENVASDAVLIVQDAVTKIKELIVSDIANGVNKDETAKKLNKIIADASARIGSLDNDLAEEARRSLVISTKKWYYTYSVNVRVLNTALVQDFKNTIIEYQQGTGMSQTNRLYTIDINALTNELSNSKSSVAIRTVLDKFRPYLKESSKGLAIIDNYQETVRDQVKVLASDPPISNRIRQDGQPYKVSLRNRAEMKVRYEANQQDIENLKNEGAKLVWTSSHADASPRCSPYQGRLWSLDGSSGTIDGIKYEPIENATSGPNGDGNGIISGYNCRHRLIEYEPKSKPPNDYSEAEIKKAYAIDQKQRYYENNIRQLKTEEKLLRANGDLDQAHSRRIQWRRLNKRYESYSHDNGRAYYPWRTRISDEEKEFNLNQS